MENQHSAFFYHVNPELGKQPASYGLTLKGLIDFQEKQQRGTQPMVPCSEEPSIMIQENEREFVYLLALESPLYDERTGQRIDRGVTTQKFNIAAFDAMMKAQFAPAHKVKILHDPIRYLQRLRDEAEKNNPVNEAEQKELLEKELAKNKKPSKAN